MFYYHVWVRSIQFRGNEALTYQYDRPLASGSIVTVPLRNQRVPGIVVKAVARPQFATKPIATVLELQPLPPTTLRLAEWLQQFYPAPIGVIAGLFLPSTLGSKAQVMDQTPTPYLKRTISQPRLTDEQVAALNAMQTPDTYLLHGRTGSGKTRIYTELTGQALKNGQSAMILSPEIGLTSQLAAVFTELFGSQVVVIHSHLTPKQRRAAWLTILTTRTPIVAVGPRSVLFTPLQNVGLIVVDESHDPAYKQEQSPHYHAIRVASQLSKIYNCTLILGSATPSVTDYYMAEQKSKTIVRLEYLAKAEHFDRTTSVVDLRDRSQFTRTPHLSLPLIKAISHSLTQGEQALLYLNRRGTARVALCEHCGWQALCPNCDVSLTYHGDDHALRCHVCGFRQDTIMSCPACHRTSITFRSFGTKAIVDEVGKVFPEARIMRFDADSLKSERLENQYQRIIDGKIDILIGTQMLTKGLDLPRLSTLGVILADSSLYLPDYTAQERTYQLLSQVIGRIGRGHVKSHAVIQTYRPDSSLLTAALHNDWEAFYHDEIIERKRYFFPPFCHLLKLSSSRTSTASAEKAAESLRSVLVADKLAVRIDGPAPAFHEKVGGSYRWQLIVKARERNTLLAIIKKLPKSGWTYDLDPADLL